jgi:2-keto-4-pentenoate hydratase
MRDEPTFEQIAADLLQARDAARLTTMPSRRLVGFDLDSGYQVGRLCHQRLVERGYQPVGRKVGFTNRATWREFDLDTPIWAHLAPLEVELA